MVFQSYAVWPHMTVRQNVVYPLKHRKLSRADARRKVDEALALVGLSEYADRPVVAAEFVGTSISSSGDGAQQGKTTPQMLSENPFVKFFNAERGYVSCEVTPKTWTSRYQTVPFVTKPDAPLVTRKTFVVERDKPGAVEA